MPNKELEMNKKPTRQHDNAVLDYFMQTKQKLAMKSAPESHSIEEIVENEFSFNGLKMKTSLSSTQEQFARMKAKKVRNAS